MAPTILYDADVDRLSLGEAVDTLTTVFSVRATNGLIAPSR